MKVVVVQYRLLASDIAAEWSRRGVDVALIEPKDLSLQTILEIQRRKYNFIFGINYSPELSSVCYAARLPYVSWTIDPIESKRWPREHRPTDLIYTFRRTWCELWSKATGCNVAYLPLAATSNRSTAVVDSAIDAPSDPFSLWVGNSCAHDWHRHSPTVRSWYANEQESIDAWIAKRVDSLEHCGSIAADLSARAQLSSWTSTAPPGWEALVDDLCAFRGRVSMLERLGDLNLEIWGDAYLRRFGQRYRGFAEHGDALTGLYRQAALTLDIPRWYQSDIVTMRVFDAMASGGAVLTYDNSDIRGLFCPGVHLETYRTYEEFEDKSHRITNDPEWGSRLRRSGMAWVNRRHRMRHRLDEIENDLRQLGWWHQPMGLGYSPLPSAASGATKSGGASTPVPKKKSSICLLSTS